ncbi:MAG: peptidylprolyl isomerase, partial [Planctomycetaceae bacterium]|nr:peptidylprolyl isomerase [Planctomycetaceae bacterium]
FAMGFAWWVQREGNSWPDMGVVRQAHAQTNTGAAPYGVSPTQPNFGAGMVQPRPITQTARPADWPGAAPGYPNTAVSAAAPPGYAPAGAPPAAAPEQKFEGTERIAQVGNEFVLLVDIMSQVNDVLAKNADRIPPNQLEQAKQFLVKQRLEQAIETKLVIADVRRNIPADKLKDIMGKIGEQFDEAEIPKALERGNFNTRAELEDDLRKYGSSIERERRAFCERMLAMSWVQQKVKFDEEITHEQMLAYYQQHVTDYDFTGRVRWQHLQVRFDKFPNKQAAYAALAEAGNKVLNGADFAMVAKTVSDSFSADKGGTNDWTTQGSLSSDVLHRALFAYPVNQLSPILEDERAFHIIRVLERREAGRTPFTDVQAEIKQKIKSERAAVASKGYLEKLKSTTQVWTVFDAERPLPTDSPAAIYSSLPAVNQVR